MSARHEPHRRASVSALTESNSGVVLRRSERQRLLDDEHSRLARHRDRESVHRLELQASEPRDPLKKQVTS